MAKKTGKLSDEQLEQISGGGIIQDVKDLLSPTTSLNTMRTTKG